MTSLIDVDLERQWTWRCAALYTADARVAQKPNVELLRNRALPTRWPVSGGVHVALPLSILPASIAAEPWHSAVLPEWAVDAKLNAIRAHYSQWLTSRGFLAGFVRANEIYVPAADLPEITAE